MTGRLRAVFAGTADFSVPSLEATAAHCDLVAVVTQPGRPGDRGRPAPRPVADAAAPLGVPVLQPAKIRAQEAVDEILGLGADVLVVAAYGQILPQRLLDGFRLGGVNVHASVLPRWRGAAPVNAAILHGDDETGVSIMRMEAGLDTGPVYAVSRVRIPQRATAPGLTATLATLGAGLLGDVLDELAAGPLDPVPQDDESASYAPRLSRGDGTVDWAVHNAVDIDRMVRGLQPWPGVTATIDGRPVRVWAGEVVGGDGGGAEPGSIVASGPGGVDVATLSGLFRLTEVQAAGSRRMAASEYMRGVRH